MITNGAEPVLRPLLTRVILSLAMACTRHVTLVRGAQNDTMTISVRGLPARTGFDLFGIQTPNTPFGVAWYQSDLQTDRHGKGTVVVKGIFNKETFTVDTDPAHAVPPTHQFHLGLWFNNPAKPFNLGREGTATAPIVTPFDGEQHAGGLPGTREEGRPSRQPKLAA